MELIEPTYIRLGKYKNKKLPLQPFPLFDCYSYKKIVD